MSVIRKCVEGVDFTVVNVDNMTEEEMKRYIDFIRKETNQEPTEIDIILSRDGMIDLSYKARTVPFERIRRITGKPEK